MPIYSDYISMYFIVHLKACAAQIRERSNKLTRVPQSGVKLDVSRIDSVLENRERQIERDYFVPFAEYGGLHSA